MLDDVLSGALIELGGPFHTVLEALLARQCWWLPERYVLCLWDDIPLAVQYHLYECFVIHNGWGFYYFCSLGCVMLEIDNPVFVELMTNACKEERTTTNGKVVNDLSECGELTYFSLVLEWITKHSYGWYCTARGISSQRHKTYRSGSHQH